MIRLPRYGSTHPDGRKSITFDHPHPNDLMGGDQLPAYDPHGKNTGVQMMTLFHD